MNIDSTSSIHPLPYGATTNPLNPVFADVDYVPIRGKIQTAEMTFNGTILLNRDDLCRALGIVNYNQYGMQDRNALLVCYSHPIIITVHEVGYCCDTSPVALLKREKGTLLPTTGCSFPGRVCPLFCVRRWSRRRRRRSSND